MRELLATVKITAPENVADAVCRSVDLHLPARSARPFQSDANDEQCTVRGLGGVVEVRLRGRAMSVSPVVDVRIAAGGE